MIHKFNFNLITLFFFSSSINKFRGTWASLFTTLFLFLLIHILKIQNFIVLIFLFVILFYSFYAIKSCLKDFKDEDPQEIVIDEFLGQSIPIILYEFFHSNQSNSTTETLQIYFWFFLLFRLFDGLKPFPIDYIDKNFKNTFGILFDDILAGFYVVISLILFMVGKTLFFNEKIKSKNSTFINKKKISLSIAESCTGGLLSSTITSINGSSKIFKMGLVTYSNQSKKNLLKVPNKIINDYGAVSSQCCESMVNNLKKISKCDITVAITGIAGPTGGSKQKPIGLVYIGIIKNKRVFINKFHFLNKGRFYIQKNAVVKTLKLLLELIK